MPPTVKCVAATFTTVPPWLVGSLRRMTLRMILLSLQVASVIWPDQARPHWVAGPGLTDCPRHQ